MTGRVEQRPVNQVLQKVERYVIEEKAYQCLIDIETNLEQSEKAGSGKQGHISGAGHLLGGSKLFGPTRSALARCVRERFRGPIDWQRAGRGTTREARLPAQSTRREPLSTRRHSSLDGPCL